MPMPVHTHMHTHVLISSHPGILSYMFMGGHTTVPESMVRP